MNLKNNSFLSTTAFLLLLPYAGWIGFLTILSFDLVELNHRFISNRKIPKNSVNNRKIFKKSGLVLPQVLKNNRP